MRVQMKILSLFLFLSFGTAALCEEAPIVLDAQAIADRTAKLTARAKALTTAMDELEKMSPEDPLRKVFSRVVIDGYASLKELQVDLEKQQADINKRAAALQALVPTAKAPTLEQVNEKARLELAASVRRAEMRRTLEKTRFGCYLRLSQVLRDGAWLGYWSSTGKREDEAAEPIYVIGGQDKVDGDTWAGYLYPCGTYQYQTVSGAAKTVRKFAVTIDGALQELEL